MPVSPACKALRCAQDFDEVIKILEGSVPEFDDNLLPNSRVQYFNHLKRFNRMEMFADSREALETYRRFGSGIISRQKEIASFCRDQLHNRHSKSAFSRLDKLFGYRYDAKPLITGLPFWQRKLERSPFKRKVAAFVARRHQKDETPAIAVAASEVFSADESVVDNSEFGWVSWLPNSSTVGDRLDPGSFANFDDSMADDLLIGEPEKRINETTCSDSLSGVNHEVINL